MKPMKALLLSLTILGGLSVAAGAAPEKLSKTQLDPIVAGANPHPTLNPGGQTGGCQSNPNCAPTTGNPHTTTNPTGSPH